MSSEIRRGDEKFLLGATAYEFMFPQHSSPLGSSSASPFAQKIVSGERLYSDYDVVSSIAFSDFAGGMGQDRAVDLTKYYGGVNIDTRGGRLVLGADQVMSDWVGAPAYTGTGNPVLERSSNYTTVSWLSWTEADYTIASFVAPTGCTSIQRLWLPLRHTGNVTSITVTTHLALSGDAQKTVVLTPTLFGKGYWQEVVFATPWTVTAGVTYWVMLDWAGDGVIYWYGADVLEAYANAYTHTGVAGIAGWARHSTPRYQVIWVEGVTDHHGVDSPLRYLVGAGADSVTRLWGWGGQHIYHWEESSTTRGMHVEMDGAGTPAVKNMGYDITDAVWWKDSAASTHSLYIALGATEHIQKYNGNVGTEVFAEMGTGYFGTKLCVQDTILWRSYSGNQVNGATLDTDWAADAATVGSTVYPVKFMCVWQGKLYVGKQDGLWAIAMPSGYPAMNFPTAELILDFGSQIHENNFDFMVVHQDDLFFPIGGGIMRFTTGGVLTPVTPLLGADKRQSQTGVMDTRTKYRAAFSSLNMLWVAAEGPMEMQSGILCYVDGAWTPIITFPRYGDMARGVIIEPGLYGDAPRLYYSEGLQPNYSYMPTTTLRRWERDRVTENQTASWADSGYLETSWFDGNILTVDKHWIDLTLYVRNTGVSPAPSYLVYWRPDENTGWASLAASQAISSGAVELAFPAGSYSKKMALRIYLVRGYYTSVLYVETPVVEAAVIRYMERPEDSKVFSRAYDFSDFGVWRNGEQRAQSMAQQYADLRTLRESKAPLTWTAWWGTSYTVHIVEYATTEVRESVGTVGDQGRMIVTMKLQEV